MSSIKIFRISALLALALALLPAKTVFAADKPRNLAPNPSFEQGVGLETPRAWSTYVLYPNSDLSRMRGDAYAGKYSVCITDPIGTAYWQTSEPIPVTPGRTYTFGVEAKGHFVQSIYMILVGLDADGSITQESIQNVLFNDTAWSDNEMSMTITDRTAGVLLVMGYTGFNLEPGNGSVCFDAVSFQ